MCSSAAIVGIVGGVLSAGSTMRGASTAAGGMRFDANVRDREAAVAELEKSQMIEQFKQERSNVTAAEQQDIGSGRAAFAASNVQLGSGSAAEFDKAVQSIASRERAALRERQSFEEFASDVEIGDLRAEAKSLRKGAKSVVRSGRLGAGAAFFGKAAGGVMQGQGKRTPKRRSLIKKES